MTLVPHPRIKPRRLRNIANIGVALGSRKFCVDAKHFTLAMDETDVNFKKVLTCVMCVPEKGRSFWLPPLDIRRANSLHGFGQGQHVGLCGWLSDQGVVGGWGCESKRGIKSVSFVRAMRSSAWARVDMFAVWLLAFVHRPSCIVRSSVPCPCLLLRPETTPWCVFFVKLIRLTFAT